MAVIYGIPNCDTVKKARSWLTAAGVDYQFVDFKKTPPDEALIRRWLQDIPLETLLNRRGTTWRPLCAHARATAESEEGAVRLMAAHPSMIKRPVLDNGKQCYAGFQPELYETVLAEK